jgi:recombination protein RecA
VAKSTSPVEGRLLAAVQAKQEGKIQSQLANRPLDSDVVDWVDTQAASLNYAIGRPGIPQGRLTVLVGKEKAGKSTVAYHLLQETQRRGGVAILVDAERRYSRDRAERIGIDHDRLIYMPGETVQSTFQELYTYVEVVRDELPDQLVTIAWDSLAGTPTEANLKGEIRPAEHARLVGHWFRVLLPLVARKRITFVMVNQLRTKMDMGGGTYFSGGSSDAMIAERALDYHCSLKVHFTQVDKLGDKKKPTGITTRADVRWNTVAPPFRKALVHINFLDGIDRDACAFEAAKDAGLVKQSTSWWEYPGYPKFQGGHTKKWSEILGGDEELRRLIAAAPLDWLP